MISCRDNKLQRISMALVLAVLMFDLLWAGSSQLHFTGSQVAVNIAIALILAFFLMLAYSGRIGDAGSNLLVDITVLMAFCFVGFVFSYLMVGLGQPLRDEQLMAIDRLLGFDWLQYNRFILKSDWLWLACLVLYILPPVLLLVGIVRLHLTGNVRLASSLVIVIIISGVACIVVSGFVSAAGAVGWYSPVDEFYQGRYIFGDTEYKQHFFRLQQGESVAVSVLLPKGVVAFPSYHAALAAICIFAWPKRPTFYTVILLNFLGLLAIPVLGGHHLIDVIAGFLVGLLSIALMYRQTVLEIY